MASDNVVAPEAARNAARANAHPLLHLYARLLMQLDAAINHEHRLLRCDGRDPGTDDHLRAAELAWTRVARMADLVIRLSGNAPALNAGAELVRTAVAHRDAVGAPTVFAGLVGSARTLAQAQGESPAAPLLDVTCQLLMRAAVLEGAELSGPTPQSPDSAGACPNI
jgi:predicted hotdog family 3-hydroxylacyl-ACP dehydratase